jgi:hypothetical protein
MLLDMFLGATDVLVAYPVRYALKETHYTIKLNNEYTKRDIEYEKFDYNIIQPNISPFADTLVNEMWPFFRQLWRMRGGYEAEVKFSPELDLKEFGSQYGPGQYWATYKFKISDDGKWTADFDIKFEQVDNPYDDREYPPAGRKGPFYAQDYSRMQSNTVKRARKLAKPTWSVTEGRSGQDFADLLNEEAILNQTIDFSFNLKWKGEGDWGDYKSYEVKVSDEAKESLPEKEEMHKPTEVHIPISSITRRHSKPPTPV